MTWEDQRVDDIKFVDWGVLKKGHDADKTIVVKEKEFIEGEVLNIKTHEVFKYMYKIKSPKHDSDILIMGNAALNKQFIGIGLGEKELEAFIPIEVGNKVKMTYHGLYSTEHGGKGFSIQVQVDR